jgi:hypothetical protein
LALRRSKLHVFGKEMLETLDAVFWMIPFSSKKQAQITRQENEMRNGKNVATLSRLSTGFLLQRNSLSSIEKRG